MGKAREAKTIAATYGPFTSGPGLLPGSNGKYANWSQKESCDLPLNGHSRLLQPFILGKLLKLLKRKLGNPIYVQGCPGVLHTNVKWTKALWVHAATYQFVLCSHWLNLILIISFLNIT